MKLVEGYIKRATETKAAATRTRQQARIYPNEIRRHVPMTKTSRKTRSEMGWRMLSMSTLGLFLTLPLLTTGTSTPEPQMDPFMTPPPSAPRGYIRLFVSPAGAKGNRMGKTRRLSLRGVNYVCRDKYATGLSVRCDVRPGVEWVQFRVDGKDGRVEREVPYFLKGDWMGSVEAWDVRKRRVVVGCRPRGRKAVRATIVFRC